MQINSGARAGAETKVATKAGAAGWASLNGLFALLVSSYLMSKRNKHAQSLLLVCAASLITSLISSDAQADESQLDSSPQTATQAPLEDQFFKGFIADLSFGYSNLEPEAPSNIWTQNRDHGAAFAVGVGYQFTNQFSITLRYYDFHTIKLNSSDPLYDDVSIEYRVLELAGTYRFTQLWESQFAPFILGGVGYLDPKIKGDTDSVTTEEDNHLAYGVGISLSPMKHGMFDLVWQSMAGEVDLISLRLTVDVPN
ncbi:hypothetical protein A3715_09515 [Oleiphilus sp. HI0009]|nr:hypothetical protein A3715_09515 [Oleiphilus sp. HI0009]KZY66237.1 hypothetical protein A3738_06845 [Oleiphilus sp. HI0066]KZY71972.1 hypothetical protein A3739_03640 [Oleiphilus sp. HI0067]